LLYFLRFKLDGIKECSPKLLEAFHIAIEVCENRMKSPEMFSGNTSSFSDERLRVFESIKHLPQVLEYPYLAYYYYCF
jgi:hypothetical protein